MKIRRCCTIAFPKTQNDVAINIYWSQYVCWRTKTSCEFIRKPSFVGDFVSTGCKCNLVYYFIPSRVQNVLLP